MVFEAIVVDLLNKFLKQYIENLDTSQLKIGIWGGDVVLKDLIIKSTIFDDLNLPVRVKWGKLGKLTLKIPWKNLYSAPVIVEIEELLILIIPNIEFKYDPVKEEKWVQEKKQAKLRAIEEAKKREVEETSVQKDSFMEKLFTQITKNLQIGFCNIHIRYEDKTTVPGSPFSVGVTLSNLSVHTTNSDPSMNLSKHMQRNENFICKLVELEGLAIYLNSGSALFSELPSSDLRNILLDSIPSSVRKPDGFMYLFGPLSASAFFRLNPKPEADGSNFTIPKIFVNVHLKEIELAITHYQFCDIMSYVQDFQRFLAATKYRKYRPVGISVIGHAKEWWHFAYTAVLEDIIRRKNEWCWENIKNHRETCRRYLTLFKTKLSSKKMSPEDTKELEELEKKLNVFNLVLIREQVYVEVERDVKENTSGGGWFSGWFGYSSDQKLNSKEDELVKKIRSVMTTQEKQKLYKAIGYEESSPPTNYPIEFVQSQFCFHLDEIKTTIYDDRSNYIVPVMKLSVRPVSMELEERPSAFAMKFVLIIGNFQVIGKQEKDETYPELVTSNCTESESLIELQYETKPLNASCDQRVIVSARPLRIIFHSETINLMREVFKTRNSEEMEKIVAVTSASLPTFQRITSLGLQYAIEKRAELELKVNIMSSYLIVPYGGVYHPDKDMLVLLLGSVKIETDDNLTRNVSVKKLYLEGTTDEEIFSTVVSASYTNFRFRLTGVQILFQISGEDWVSASKKQRSALQFLEPTNLEIIIKKSLVMDDARIPKMIIEGKMPSLAFNFSEDRFLSFVALASSISMNTEKPATISKKGMSASLWSIHSLGAQLENKFMHMQKDLAVTKTLEYVQGIDLVGHFQMNEFTVNVTKTKREIDSKQEDGLSKEFKANVQEKKFLYLSIEKLEMEFTSKTFEVINLFKLGGIDFKQYHNKDWLTFVSTKGQGHEYLFVVEYINLDTKIPDFYTTKGAIVNRLTLNITPLNVLLEKAAVLAQLEFVTSVQRRVDQVRESFTPGHMADAGKPREIIYEEFSESQPIDKKVIAKGKRFRRKTGQKEVIDFFLQASLEEIEVVVEFKSVGLLEFSLKGGSVEISSRKSYLTVDANIREILVLDLDPRTSHPKIITSLERQTLASRVTIYDKEYFGSENSLDMSVEAEVGGIQCTVVTVFFSRAFEFLSAFQTQIQSLKQGATIAAQKAKENVVKAFHNAAEVCLKVKITAPTLVIPQTSTSLETLIVDFGVLTIKNSISELDYQPDQTTASRPLIDTVKVHLQNLKMARCTLTETRSFIENEKIFLVPVTFDLSVKRNLSKEWFTVIPELEILARLATVQVTLTHDDLCAIMNIVQNNLSEGDDGQTPAQTVSPPKPEQKPAVKTKEQSLFYHHEAVMEDEEQVKDSSNYYTLVKFVFFMESFVFDAISERSDEKHKEVGLARFVLEAMSVKGRLFSNNSVYTSVMLVRCLLEDMRPGKEGRLTRLMERTDDVGTAEFKAEPNRTNSMFEIIFQKKEDDRFVDVRVYKFTLILSMDFLQKVGVFFTLEDDSSQDNVKQSVRHVDKESPIVTEKDIPSPTFTINIRLEKPDIIFVENMDSMNADALVFHTEMFIKYRVAAQKQIISGTLNDIELYSCCFNPTKRSRTLNQVIKPFTVSIAGSTPEGSGLHVDICLTDISISINPNTVNLISKCCEALMKDSLTNEKSACLDIYSDLWDVKHFEENDYWFLKTEVGEDALMNLKSSPSVDDNIYDQICLLAIPSINILLEGVSTSRAQPLVLVEMGFQMRCYNWSQTMTLSSTLTLQMQYYNKLVSNWEPLIEPVEKYSEQNKQSYVPWELHCSIICGDEGEIENLRPPRVQIILSCTEMLQVTLTKTGIDLLKSTMDKYTSAVTKHEVKKLADLPPYVVRNETGLIVEILLEDSRLQMCKSFFAEYSVVRLDSSSEVELQNAYLSSTDLQKNVSLTMLRKDTRLFIRFPENGNHVLEVQIGMPSKRHYLLPTETSNGRELWAVVSDVSVEDNSTTVVLRSIFTVVNYFKQPINIHTLSKNKTVAEYVGVVEGNSSFNLPLSAVYNADKHIFFSVHGYSLCIEPFDWSDFKPECEVSSLLQCISKVPESQDPFFIQAVGESEEIYSANTNRKWSGSVIFNLHLQPTVKISNSLPVPLVICFQGSAKEELLQPGNNLQITNAEPGTSTVTLRIDDYLEKVWSCKETILENPPEFFIWKFVSYNGLTPETLNLGVHVTYKRKTAVYTVYCPYVMINKTEHLLSYKFEHSSTVFYHPGKYNAPIMFSPVSKKYFSKKLATLQVEQSSWSDKFPVDAAGSGGTIECHFHDSNIVYKISVTISLTYNSLTKLVVFTPFYVLINSMDYGIECQECEIHDGLWLMIQPHTSLPFWPRSQAKDATLRVRPNGSDAVTPPFAYHSTDVCLLRLSDKYGGINVTVKATQSGTYITFSSYEPGQAPVLIINHSGVSITLTEMKTDFKKTLKPSEQMMHAWLCPTGERKLVVLNTEEKNAEIPLNEDVDGVLYLERDKMLRYVSFLDGVQRVLLFTEDSGLSRSLSSIKLSSSGVELVCKIQGIGFSLVNDINRLEVLYLTFLSSGIVWESRKVGRNRFKKMKEQDSFLLENAYQLFQEDLETHSDVDPIVNVQDNVTVDFEKMVMIEPVSRELKRTFETGLWLAYRQIEDQVMLHVKINRIQMDNQLLDCVFPVVLAAIPPPKTVATVSQGPKPFLELSIVKIATDRSGVEQYKYFKILVQEFHVKVDIGFIQQMYLFLAPAQISDEQEKLFFKKDLEFMQQPLKAHVDVATTNEQKNFYDLLHFSPLKIHFSFSMAGKLQRSGHLPPSLSVMLQSLGVTLTDVHDVVFRLSYLERKCVFLTNRELINEVTTHYYGQIIRQAYVLLLGLDVIGNPYGLIVGIGEGVEAFFYEPFQGMIRGPSEFGKGVAIGWKSLFGHTVGSAAGTLGKLTETLGKGLAVLSLDKEYQMQRMVEHNQNMDIQASMARGGRDLFMGMVEGVTGVVQKPIKGAKEEGVGGFLKGMGKGMVGLVTRPVTGIVDFASTSLNAVKSATVLSAESKRLRPPRFFRNDNLVEPYNLREAQGHMIFFAICRLKYCNTDKYEYHLYLREKEVVVLTNKRIILADFSEVFGTWQEHMAILWSTMPERPRCHTKGVALTMPKRSNSSKNKPEVKVLLIEDVTVKEEICQKMIELYNLEKQHLEELKAIGVEPIE